MGRQLVTPMTIPTTAGKRISEDQLRSAARCLEQQALGGELSWSPLIAAARWAWEACQSHSLRRGDNRKDFWRVKYLQQAMEKHDLWFEEDPLETEEGRSIMHMFGEIDSILIKENYVPIWPPDHHWVKVSKTPVQVILSGIYYGPDGIDIVDFTPYEHRFDVINDPTLALKTKLIQSIINYQGKITIHTFGYDRQNQVRYTRIDNTNLNTKEFKRTKTLVQSIEQNYHWPSNPCPDKTCPFLQACQMRQ